MELAPSFLKKFARKEDGTATIFACFMIMMMVLVGGIGVDLMAQEQQRTRLQAALDRAVLAAADLDQPLSPRAVVEDYVAKAGFAHADLNVAVDEGSGTRSVTASARVIYPTRFMRLMGADTLPVPTRAAATETALSLEVAMVLDISGSMSWNGKIDSLKAAAKALVEQMDFTNDGTTLTIVPYEETVNIGADLAGELTMSPGHVRSNCVRFPENSFRSTAIRPHQEIQKLGYYDRYSNNGYTDRLTYPSCNPDRGEVLLHADNPAEINTYIDGFIASGNTAIDLGVKTAVGLLDPAISEPIRRLAAAGTISPRADGHPYAWGTGEKHIILMSDGENTTQYDLKEEFKSGISEVWMSEEANGTRQFSVLVEDLAGTQNDVWWWEDTNSYHNQPAGSAAQALSNEELYEMIPVAGVVERFYYWPTAAGRLDYRVYEARAQALEVTRNHLAADETLSQICNAARVRGVTIFTVAVEAPARGQAALEDCASSPSHHYNVKAADLEDTFRSIGRTISVLRLSI